jgi:pimeloyl-ACP methyl ester carboxylesterase
MPAPLVTTDWVPSPWRDTSGNPVLLEMVCYRPRDGGPFPTIIMNHGSTGGGNDPSRFKLTWVADELGEFLVSRGWQVLFPQRRGRGRSGGLYDEGFEPDRARYSCDPEITMSGLNRALADLDMVVSQVLRRPDVERERVFIGGKSRGGVLSLVYAAMHPRSFHGVINFVGGWLGETCTQAPEVNATLFVRSASFPRPSLWIYSENDRFYSIRHSRDNFRRFTAAGGHGQFHVVCPPAGTPGHDVHKHPELWEVALGAYLSGA